MNVPSKANMQRLYAALPPGHALEYMDPDNSQIWPVVEAVRKGNVANPYYEFGWNLLGRYGTPPAPAQFMEEIRRDLDQIKGTLRLAAVRRPWTLGTRDKSAWVNHAYTHLDLLTRRTGNPQSMDLVRWLSQQLMRVDPRYRTSPLAEKVRETLTLNAYGRGAEKQQKKRTLRQSVFWYTTENHDAMQRHIRAGVAQKTTRGSLKAGRATDHLVAYFQKFALRAPQMPPGQFVNGTSRFLYRGTRHNVQRFLSTRSFVEKGFLSFSRDKTVTEREFAYRGGLVLMVDVFEIPRGTPWVWMGGVHREFNRTKFPHEAEVLLPPGRLDLVGNVSKVNGIYYSRAKFSPDPAFLRAAVVGRAAATVRARRPGRS